MSFFQHHGMSKDCHKVEMAAVIKTAVAVLYGLFMLSFSSKEDPPNRLAKMGAMPTPFKVMNTSESPAPVSVSPVVPETTPEPAYSEDIPGWQHNLFICIFPMKVTLKWNFTHQFNVIENRYF